MIQVRELSHRYRDRTALDGVSFSVDAGELFGVLGPNGGGKSTLFRVLSTLVAPQSGAVSIDGNDVAAAPRDARRALGVVFQSPALDGLLTVRENLTHQGHLYGLRGAPLRERVETWSRALGVVDRLSDRVDTLSGGLRRRAEVAKALLHDPKLLLLDEPTHGLDPRARRELWDLLDDLRRDRGLTVAVTTHLLDEAERCARLLILDQGSAVALDTPDALKSELPGEVVWVDAPEPDELAPRLARALNVAAEVVGERIRIGTTEAAPLAGLILEAFGDEADSVTVGKPSLEDVFIHRTGRPLEDSDSPAPRRALS